MNELNDLQIFKSEDFGEIRTVTINNEPWFVGKDVAVALGYKNTADAIGKHVDTDDKLTSQIAIAGQRRDVTVINESGLYSLILSSKLESSKKFKRWVTSEVLPSIRKHGVYAVDELLNNPDMAIKAFTALKEEREKNKILQAENQRMRPKEIFADAVAVSDDAILIGELAKIIKQNGQEIGQNRLFEWLRKNNYLISRNGTDYNMPTQKSMELKLFRIKERTINNPDGSIRITKTVLVTGKGQQYFINKFLSSGQMKLPLMAID